MASSVIGLGSPRLGAVILAGGTSSRMGTDKASLMVHQTPLLARVAAAMAEPVHGPIVVVGNASRSLRVLTASANMHDPRRFWDYTCVDDPPGPSGPAHALCSGVETLMSRFPSIERIVVSPCDLPRVTARGFSHLLDIDARSTIDVDQSLFDESTPRATVVRIDGRPQWLSAVLNRPLIGALTHRAVLPQRRVSDLFVDVPITWFDDVGREFIDADTPIDLREATASRPVDSQVPAALADAS